MKQVPSANNIPLLTERDIFRPGEGIYVQLSSQYPDLIGVIHKHTFIELVYILSGSAVHVVGDRQVPASKGDLFIINYDTPHAFFQIGSEPLVAYDLMFTPGFLDASLLDSVRFESIQSSFLFYSLFPSQQLGPDVHISSSSYSAFGELFNKMYLEFNNRENGYIGLLRAYLVELIIKIFRKMDSEQATDASGRQKQIVESTLAYLRANYQNHLSLSDLAAQVFLSKDYFARLFRETTGIPVSTLLQKIRIDEACRLLTTTDTKTDRIAELCGFSDAKHFFSTFKKITGTTPRQYKLNNTKKEDSDNEMV